MAMAKVPERNKVESTAFSRFIRNASSAERKRVYGDVLRKATDRQNAVCARNPAPATGKR